MARGVFNFNFNWSFRNWSRPFGAGRPTVVPEINSTAVSLKLRTRARINFSGRPRLIARQMDAIRAPNRSGKFIKVSLNAIETFSRFWPFVFLYFRTPGGIRTWAPSYIWTANTGKRRIVTKKRCGCSRTTSRHWPTCTNYTAWWPDKSWVRYFSMWRRDGKHLQVKFIPRSERSCTRCAFIDLFRG